MMQQPKRYLRHLTGAVGILTGLLLVASVLRAPVGLTAGFNHNSHGVINYCTLSGTTTTIHGWAHDPDAPNGNNPTVTIKVGSLSATVKTNISGYHDTAINKYLQSNWPGAPTGSIYGFTASFSTLYKGTAYAVSGVANNIDAGTQTNMSIDTTAGQTDGIVVSTLFTSSRTLPDACLVSKPVPAPTPAPTPSPSPTPTPTPTPTKSGSSTPATHKSTGGLAVTTAPTSSIVGSVAAGTLSAVITTPSDGAATIAVSYGSSTDDSAAYNTDPVDASSGTASITLLYLTPKTDYTYQLIRTDAAGKVTTSSPGTFTTTGYVAKLHFVDGSGKPVSGIHGAINDDSNSAAVSDKNGDMSFGGLGDGQYTVTFHYGKLNFTRDFNTETAGDGSSDPANAIVLKDVVNVSKLTGGSKSGYTGPAHHSAWPIILLIVLFLAAAAAAVWWWLRRRKNAGGYLPLSGDYALATLPSATSPLPPIKPPKKVKHRKDGPQPEHLEHVGESLRDMVIKSMHEEAQRRKNGPQK